MNPLSAFTGKGGKWSQLRVVAFMFALAFISNWPSAPWGPWDWAAMTVIVLAPAIDALFSSVPLMELFGSLGAWAGGVIEKRLPKKEDLP